MSEKDAQISRQLSAVQTKDLLSIGSRATEPGQNWLFEVADFELMEMLLTDMRTGTIHSGAALMDAVCSPDTPVEALRAIKDLAKSLAKGTQAEDQQGAAATLLYHLAVASALGYHEENISSMDAAARLPVYREFVAEICDDSIGEVFEKALEELSDGRE